METNITVDYRLVFRKIWARRRLFCIVLAITFVVSSLLIICVPRGYVSETEMVPETEESISNSALASVAGSFGFDIGNMQQSTDAIVPMLYPDLMYDNGFIASLFKIKVGTLDKEISTDYYTYLKKYRKHAWWEIVAAAIGRVFMKKEENLPDEFDPYHVSRRDATLMGFARKDIDIDVNKKTGVITISVTAQDALICKTLADSVRTRLENYITEYRTNKARLDYAYYTDLAKQAKTDFEEACRMYDNYCDSHNDLNMQKFMSRKENLYNDMELKYNAYSTVMVQMNAARSKIQDKTPAFTTIKGASVPVKAAKPKRMFFVLGCMAVAFVITCLYVLRSIILPGNK